MLDTKMLQNIKLILFIWLFSHATYSQINLPEDKDDFHIFVLMGQSNMAGFAELEPGDEKVVPGIYKIPTIGAIEWHEAAHPLHNRLSTDKFGLGLSFAKAYKAANPSVRVGLISCAYGGAEIDQLKKGSEVYAEALARIEFAQQSGVIKGILWHQGEGDTLEKEQVDSYEQKLKQLIADIRQDVGDDDLPFIIGNISELYGLVEHHVHRMGLLTQIRSILRRIPQEMQKVGFVESSGMEYSDPDYVHFDRAGYIELGKRYFEAYTEVIAGDNSLLQERESGTSIVWLSNSITHQCRYSQYVENYFLMSTMVY